MDKITMMANIIGFTVVVFVAVAFITLAIFYFNAQKKLLDAGLEDDELRREARARFAKLRGKCVSADEAELYLEKRRKTSAVFRRIMWGTVFVIYVLVIGFTLFSNTVIGERHMWLGDTAMLVIQTDSMATAHKSNRYLFDASGKADERTAYRSSRLLRYREPPSTSTP